MLTCKILGHKWRYKDYTSALDDKGNKYPYTATRLCKRCEKKEFKLAKWVDEKLINQSDTFH